MFHSERVQMLKTVVKEISKNKSKFNGTFLKNNCIGTNCTLRERRWENYTLNVSDFRGKEFEQNVL